MFPVDPEIGESLKLAGAEFLSADIDTALNFIQVALSARDSEGKFRNKMNARKAYETVSGMLPRLHLSPEQQSKINKKLAKLKSELQALDEHL